MYPAAAAGRGLQRITKTRDNRDNRESVPDLYYYYYCAVSVLCNIFYNYMHCVTAGTCARDTTFVHCPTYNTLTTVYGGGQSSRGTGRCVRV